MIYLLVGLLIVGALLIAVPQLREIGDPWEGILADFGIAFVISGVLGLTVERYTRLKFAKDLARDVFRAIFGYVLPKDFRDEMRWIYGQNAICEEHYQNVEIHKLEGGRVEFICDMERRIKNVTGRSIEINVGLGIDEWFETSPSNIEKFGYQVEGGKRVELPSNDISIRRQEKGRPTLSTKQCNVKVPSDKSVTVWLKFREVKPVNSDQHAHFTYTTKNPRVRVQCDEGIEAVVAFPRETEENKVQYLHGVYRYNGLVLPAQEIRVRWWEKDKFNAWRATTQDDP